MTKEIKEAEAIEAEKAESLELASPSPTASLGRKLSVALNPVAEQRTEWSSLATSTLSEPIPEAAWKGLSELELSKEELSLIAEFRDAPDHIIQVRPDGGFIYVPHIHLSRAMTAIFGTSWGLKWGTVPVVETSKNIVYQGWFVYVRGCCIGYAVGAAAYYDDNRRMNKSDVLESAKSEALHRIIGKGSLGIYSNVYDPTFQKEWSRSHVVKVWVKDKHGARNKCWRRFDDDPLEGEERPASGSPALATIAPPESPQNAAAQPSVGPARSTPEPSGAGNPPSSPPTAQPKAPRTAPPSKPSVAAAELPSKDSPKPTTEQMVAENNIRMFMGEARRRGLIVGNDAVKAIEFLVDTVGLPFERDKCSGKTQIEIIRHLLFGQRWRRFTDEILPKLMEIEK